MRILWFSWKDRSHPLAGGAEFVAHELAKRLVKDGHAVTFITSAFAGCAPEEVRDGYRIVRVGNRYSVYWHAYRFYKKNIQEKKEKQNKYDLILEEINTIPFFTSYYVREKNILLMHQFARQIWFYQMFFPLSLIGFLLEPIYLWLLRKNNVITVSKSTRSDLIHYGFKPNNIHLISEGIEMQPLRDIASIQKYETPTLLSLGAVRPMKRTLHIVKAFEIAKQKIPALKLIIAGDASGAYGEKVRAYIKHSPFSASIRLLGKVDATQRLALLRRSHAIAVTSVREGWGLIVTEAASQGTPAVVYNVHGLRDSVRDGVTGYVTPHNTPQALADTLVTLLNDQKQYDTLRTNAWQWSHEVTFEKSYENLMHILK